MEWLFRRMPANEVERDVTQRSQFDTDEARIEATLIRESHQNSLDARVPGSTKPVTTKISFFKPDGNEDYFEALFFGLQAHLSASNIDLSGIDCRKPPFLLLEDFGTTGLTGKWNAWDQNPFSDFWRREGRSHKSGASNGRWGLGKLVFSSASVIRTFFGLTVRSDDTTQPLLMGQSVLLTHTLNGTKYVPHGFYATSGPDEIQLPETNANQIAAFQTACGLKRTDEPGFSVAIPFPIAELKPESLITGVIDNYFFPILTGRLEVQIQGELISAATFDAIASKYASGKAANPQLIDFIRKVDNAKDKSPNIVLPHSWPQGIEDAIPAAQLESLRKSFGNAGTLIHARAPIALRRKSGAVENTHFDLFLSKAPEGYAGESLYVRSTITIPQESRNFHSPDTFGALLAKETAIASFLGDAENPAHTQWNGSGEKLKENWKAAPARLSEVRGSLRNLYRALSQLEEFTEPDALIDFFSVAELPSGKKPASSKIPAKAAMPDLPPGGKIYRIASRKGGFTVRPGSSLTEENVPVLLKLRVAYDVMRGNPLKKYDPLDFRLDSAPIKIAGKGATWTSPSPNRVDIKITAVNFNVEIDGFDPNRDLLVDARRESQ